MKTLIICSGGLDSVTLAHKIASEPSTTGLILVSFDYGQRHKKEIEYAKKCAQRLNAEHHVVNLSSLTYLLSGSALTDDIDVPEGHYAEESMKATVVPNRNAIMLTIAFGIANAKGYDRVATAVHGGDHFIYPDCRPAFTESFQTMQDHALEGLGEIALYTPYITETKTDIASDAALYHVPIEQTWSCYKGGDIHCGRCGTCVERIEALHLAGVNDPTPYEDREFWRSQINKA